MRRKDWDSLWCVITWKAGLMSLSDLIISKAWIEWNELDGFLCCRGNVRDKKFYASVQCATFSSTVCCRWLFLSHGNNTDVSAIYARSLKRRCHGECAFLR